MLAPIAYCRTPRTPLQPDAPIHEVEVPMAGVNNGWIEVNDWNTQIVFYVDDKIWKERGLMGGMSGNIAWRDANGLWSVGPPSQWRAIKDSLPPPAGLVKIQLPRFPVFPTNIQPIRKNINYIWIGTEIPNEYRLERMTQNANFSSQFTSTLHVDVDEDLLVAIKKTFKDRIPTLIISNLRDSIFFEQFKKSNLYPHYRLATTGQGSNYSAASDIMRYPLIRHYGGVYLDSDDLLLQDLADNVFHAAPNDLLLGPLVNHSDAGFEGYNSSVFASHPNNPVLDEISIEMFKRCEQNKDFFTKPRIRLQPGDPETPDSIAYANTLFKLTGPQVLNDVLALERPDYYDILYRHLGKNTTQTRYNVYDPDYVDKISKLSDHYFPFSSVAPVDIGGENSWRGT